MNTIINSSQPNKNVLFLIYLSPQKQKELTKKKFDFSSYLETISNCTNVETHTTINKELLSSASNYSVLIIVGHQEYGYLELERGYITLRELITLIPKNISVVDISICGSSIINDEMKQLSPETKLQTASSTTQIEYRLPLYSILLRNIVNKDNYFRLFNLVSGLMEKEQKNNCKNGIEELSDTTWLGKRGTDKHASIGAPIIVERNTPFLITILITKDRNTKYLESQISGIQDGATIRRGIKKLQIEDEDVIRLSLKLDSDDVHNLKWDKEENAIWDEERGETELSLSVTVLPNFSRNAFNAVLDLMINEKSIIKKSKINIKVKYSENPITKKVDYGRRLIPDNPAKISPLSSSFIEMGKKVVDVNEPDFETMKEFEPIEYSTRKQLKDINSKLDLREAYNLLFKTVETDGKQYQVIEGKDVIIRGIDLDYFEKMVKHAWFEPIYVEGLKTNIRSLIRSLSKYFPKPWFDEIFNYDYMKGVSRSCIQSATRPTLKNIRETNNWGIKTKPKTP